MTSILRVLTAASWIAAIATASSAVAESPAPPASAKINSPTEKNPAFGSSAYRSQMFEKFGMNKPQYTEKFDLSGLPHYQPEAQVSGPLRIWGNNYIGDSPLASQWRDQFNSYEPGVKIEYFLPSAAIAASALYYKLADLGMDHEPSFYDYLGHLRLLGYEPTGVSAVTGSYNIMGWQNTIVIVVHEGNPLKGLTMKEIDGVFGASRDGGWLGTQWHPEFSRGPEGNIRSWDQLGLSGEWAGKTINVYGFSLRYATALEFSNKVLQSSDKWNEALHAFGNWRRPDGTVYGEADQIMDRLKNDRYGMAYNRLNKKFPKEARTIPIAKAEGDPYIPLTLQTEQARTYPLWGDQSFWFSRKPGTKTEPKVREFLRYILSQEAQDLVQKDGKYLPLTAEAVAEERKKLD